MGTTITPEQGLRVIGPDGTVIWAGGGRLGVTYEGVVTGAAVTAMAALGLVEATTLIPRLDYLATEATVAEKVTVGLLTATAATSVALGVAQGNAASAGTVIVAGPGSIVACQATAAGTTGNYANGSATGGKVTMAASLPATTAIGTCLGKQVKGALTGGTGTVVGVFVNPLG